MTGKDVIAGPIERDLYILASHLRRAAHSIDSLQRELRKERKARKLATPSDDATEEKSNGAEALSEPLLWRDRRYGNAYDSG